MPMHRVRSKATLFFEILAEDDEGEGNERLRRVTMSAEPSEDGVTAESSVKLNGVEAHPEASSGATGGDGGEWQSENLADVLHNVLKDLYVDSSMLKMGKVLGEGGFATVSKGSLIDAHSGASQTVAVKILRPDLLSSSDDLNEFIMEANLQRKLKHRNIVRSIGIGATDLSNLRTMRLSMFLVQEYMDGGSLKDKVLNQMLNRHTEVYSHEDALRWLMEVANALHYLHAVCRPMIIHRDLKLENILLSGKPLVAKICDFGLHKRLRRRNKSSENLSTLLSAGVNEGSYYGGSLYISNLLGKETPASPGFLGYGGTPKGHLSFPEAVVAGTPSSPRHLTSFPVLSEALSSFTDTDSATTPLTEDMTSRGGQLFGHHAGHSYTASTDPLLSEERQGYSSSVSKGINIPYGKRQGVLPCSSGRGVLGQMASSVSNLAKSAQSRNSHRSNQSGGSSGGEGLTQKVGSTVYMAPEVVKGQRYNEKVDVFSFGVIMYELLMQSVILVKYAMMNDDGLNTYAERVAQGHREPIPSFWPANVRSLVEDCWREKPGDRPTFREILDRLSEIESTGMINSLGRPRSKAYSPICDCGCCAIM